MKTSLIKLLTVSAACALPMLAQAQMMPEDAALGMLELNPNKKAKITIKVSGYCSGSTVLTASNGVLMLMPNPTNNAIVAGLQVGTSSDSLIGVSMLESKPSLKIAKGKLSYKVSTAGYASLLLQDMTPPDYTPDGAPVLPSYLQDITCKNNTPVTDVLATNSMTAMLGLLPSGKASLSLSGSADALKFNYVAKSAMNFPYQQCAETGTITPLLAGIASDTFSSSCKISPVKVSISAAIAGDAKLAEIPGEGEQQP